MWLGNIDGWTAKLSKDGSLSWNRAYGGMNTDVTYSIVQGVNKSYTIAGYTRSNYDGDVGLNHGNEDCWLFNLDKDGKLVWRKNIGGSGNDIANCVISAQDGGYLLAGFTSSKDGDLSGNHGGEDAWLVKLGQDGGEQWKRMLGGSGNDVARVVIQRAEGGYLMVGSSGSSDGDVNASGGAWLVTIKEK